MTLLGEWKSTPPLLAPVPEGPIPLLDAGHLHSEAVAPRCPAPGQYSVSVAVRLACLRIAGVCVVVPWGLTLMVPPHPPLVPLESS